MNPNSIEDAFSQLPSAADDMMQGRGEYIVWEHQEIGNRRTDAKNAMGMNAEDEFWEMDRRIVRASKQGRTFYGQFIPIRGDKLNRLAGAPQSKQAAKQAREVDSYTVQGAETWRTEDGDIAYVEIEVFGGSK